MQQAYAQANETVNTANRQAQEIIDAATNDANNLRLSAISYTDEMMANMGQIMANTLEDAGSKYNEFVRSLQASLDVINRNRSELQPQLGGAPVQEAAPEAEGVSLNDDDLDDFDE